MPRLSILSRIVLCILSCYVVYYFLYRGFQLDFLDAKKDKASKCSENYGVIFDAGSTGSRVHVYKFSHCDDQLPKLLGEHFEQLKPGLSHYANVKKFPHEAAQSLVPLMDFALTHVPVNLQSCTPVLLRATAGLRLIGAAKADAILKEIQNLFSASVFHVHQNSVALMDGSDEGVYAWITVNYLLGRFSPASKLPTVAIMDLGGGSTQIVAEVAEQQCKGRRVDRSSQNSCDSYYSTKTVLQHHHLIYQNSYLGFGLMEARKRVMAVIARDWSRKGFAGVDRLPPTIPAVLEFSKELETLADPLILSHPCLSNHQHVILLAADAKKQWTALSDGDVVLNEGGESFSHYVFIGSSSTDSFSQCQAILGRVVVNDACPFNTCSFNGIHQPEIKWASTDVFIFSYFYDRTRDMDASDPTSWSLARIQQRAQLQCSSPEDEFICLDLTFMASLLSAYGLDSSNHIHVEKKINGVEMGWCLGAMIELFGQQNPQCDF